MTTTFLPTVLFLLLLNNLLLLGAPRLPALIRLTAFQGILLAVLLLCLDHALLAGAVPQLLGGTAALAALALILTQVR